MTAEQRTKQIEKIRKILALASDPSITEHEQDNYRRRARILMELYAVDFIEDPTTNAASVLEEMFVPYNGLVIDRNLFPVLPHILSPIAQYFGCFIIICDISEIGRMEYILGFKPNIEMVQYAANVVLRQGYEEYKRLYKTHRSITFGSSFWSGFAMGIEKKFSIREAMSINPKSLVLYNQVKAKFQEITEGRTRSSEIDISRPDMMRAGQEFGENVTLHTALGSQSKGNLLK